MQENTKKPAIRFAGFNDAWEQRKVSDLADFSKGSGYSKGDLKEIGTPIILYGRLYTKYQFEIGEVDTFADIKTGSVFSKGDEVIVPASGETAEDIARAAAVVKPGFLLGGDLNILHPFSFMNPSFVALSISNGQPQKELAKKAQGKSVVHIHNSDIQEVTISYPDKDEQDKIVSFFSQLDNLITLHQRKYSKLMNIKKSMLEKMFPRNGAKVPEIRFAGFTDAWEQRELGKAFDMTIPNNTLARAELNYEHGEIKSVHYGDVLIKYGAFLDAQNDTIPYITDGTLSQYKGHLLQDGDIIFADTAEDETTGKAAEIGNIGSNSVVSGLHTIVCRPIEKKAKYYLGYYLNSDAFHHQLLPLMQGIKVLSLSRSNLAKTQIMYPKNEDEQSQIGMFFHSLDELITLHQRERWMKDDKVNSS